MFRLLGRAVRILLVGVYLSLGTYLVLVGIGMLPEGEGLWDLIQKPWHFLGGLFWFGAGVLFFEKN